MFSASTLFQSLSSAPSFSTSNFMKIITTNPINYVRAEGRISTLQELKRKLEVEKEETQIQITHIMNEKYECIVHALTQIEKLSTYVALTNEALNCCKNYANATNKILLDKKRNFMNLMKRHDDVIKYQHSFTFFFAFYKTFRRIIYDVKNLFTGVSFSKKKEKGIKGEKNCFEFVFLADELPIFFAVLRECFAFEQEEMEDHVSVVYNNKNKPREVDTKNKNAGQLLNINNVQEDTTGNNDNIFVLVRSHSFFIYKDYREGKNFNIVNEQIYLENDVFLYHLYETFAEEIQKLKIALCFFCYSNDYAINLLKEKEIGNKEKKLNELTEFFFFTFKGRKLSFLKLFEEVCSFSSFFVEKLNFDLCALLNAFKKQKIDEKLEEESIFKEKINETLPNEKENNNNFCEKDNQLSFSFKSYENICLNILHICNAILTLKNPSIIESSFSEVFVIPAIVTALSVKSSSPSPKSSCSASNKNSHDYINFIFSLRCDLLSKNSPFFFFKTYYENIKKKKGILTKVSSVKFISNCLAVPILNAIEKYFPSIYIPINMDIFYQNFEATKKFLEDLENLMDQKELQKWRNSEILKAFDSKFKKNLSFSLCQREQIFQIVQFLKEKNLFNKKYIYEKQVYWLKSTVNIIKKLRFIYSDGIFIPSNLVLSLKFLTQIFLIYAEHFQTLLLFLKSKSKFNSSVCDKDKTDFFPWDEMNISYTHIGFVMSDLMNLMEWITIDTLEKEETNAKEEKKKENLEEINVEENINKVNKGFLLKTCLSKLDEITFNKRLTETEINKIQEKEVDDKRFKVKLELKQKKKEREEKFNRFLHKEMKYLIHNQLKFIKNYFNLLCKNLEDYLIMSLSFESYENLFSLKSVPHLYRMTNKACPRTASPYVESLFLPLMHFRDFLEPVLEHRMDVLSGWPLKVLAKISTFYLAEIQQVLSAVEQQEHYLRRLQKTVQSSSNKDVDHLTDYEKILLQLRVDVFSFLELCNSKFKTNSESLEEFKALQVYIENLTAEASKKFNS